MVLVNGNEVPIYELDTENIIIARIANELNTLPSFLYFPNGKESIFSDEIEVVDFLQVIRDATKAGNSTLEQFLDKNSEIITKLQLQESAIVPVWIAFNKQYVQFKKFAQLTMMARDVIEKYLNRNDAEFRRILDNYPKELELLIQLNGETVKRTEQLYQKFQAIRNGVEYTDIKLSDANFEYNLENTDLTPLEIFNSLVLNNTCPFAFIKPFYKIKNDFEIPESWIEEKNRMENTLYLKMCNKQAIETAKLEDFVNTEVKIRDSNPILETKLKLTKGYISQEEFFERIKKISLLNLRYEKITETEIIGLYFIPKKLINIHVFADIVMNNPLFSSLLNINESQRATKKKSSESTPWLYCYFNHFSTGEISFSLIQKINEGTDVEIRNFDSSIFPYGEPYIRLRVKGTSIKTLTQFIKIFSKLYVMYENEKDEIVKIYREYIPTFDTDVLVAKPDRRKPYEVDAPDLFINNYSRVCGSDKMIKLITKEEAKKLEKNRVLAFPRKKVPEGGIRYPSDGKPVKYYTSASEQYPYPGLQENRLENAEEYPFIPCCFKTDQTIRQGNAYNYYYKGVPLETGDKRQQTLITTDKILGVEKVGVLPEVLEKLFSLLDLNPNYQYIRLGSLRSKASFLHAVMMGMNSKTNILNSSKLESKIDDKRKSIADEKTVVVARQSLFEYQTDQIREMLKDTDYYLSPVNFAQLFGTMFDCNVFIFNRNGLVLPKYREGYYHFANEFPSVFIYEHNGSESDHARYPQCELIVRWKRNTIGDIVYNFDHSELISKQITRIFNKMTKAYSLEKLIKPITFPQLDIRAQEIDSMGKTRRIDIDWEGQLVSVVTPPLPQFNVAEIESNEELHTIPYEDAKRLIRKYNGKLVSQMINNDRVVALQVLLDAYQLYISIQHSEPIENIPRVNIISSKQTNTESRLQTYVQNRKLARYLTEYVYWLFSKYLHENDVEEITDKVFERFSRYHLTVRSNHVYDKIENTFSTESSIMRKNKIILQSEEMLKRVLYLLRLFTIENNLILRNYYKRKAITNYYQDIIDFDYHPEQIILYDENGVMNWINERKHTYRLHKNVIISQAPYFLINKNFGDRIYLAQYANTLQQAEAIINTWVEDGYNAGNEAKQNDVKNTYTIYRYENDNYTLVTDKNTDDKIILANEQYIALLSITN